MTVHAPLSATCKNCKRPLGTPAGIVPHFVTDDDGKGGGKPEAFCPSCFVYYVAPKHQHEDGRARFAAHFHHAHKVQGMLRPVLCKSAKCVAIAGERGMESLAHGHMGCSQCGTTQGLVVLRPLGQQAPAPSAPEAPAKS